MRFILICLVFFTFCTYADNKQKLTGQEWLKNVSQAMKARSYHGTVVFMKHGKIDTMKYQHSTENGHEQERLISLNSPLREVSRNSSEISCLYKETSQKIESHQPNERSFIFNLPVNPASISEQYLIAVAGQEIIASRPTQIIAVLPKDDLRYARKVWVDTASLLPLKVEVYDLDGNALEQVIFTDFTVEDIKSTEAPQSRADEDHSLHQHFIETEAFENSPFRLEKLPAGFEKIFFIRNSLKQSQKMVDHLLISDGFSSISIYFEAKGDNSIEGKRTIGPVNSFSRLVGDFQVTVLGEVPAETVELVASSVALH